jgi:hypothetical protein
VRYGAYRPGSGPLDVVYTGISTHVLPTAPHVHVSLLAGASGTQYCGCAAGEGAAMANASMRAAAAQFINPKPRLTHAQEVSRLYRHSLKLLNAW